jgi:hypothetical protein
MCKNPITVKLENDYGVGAVAAPWVAVLWAAEAVASEVSADVAANALKQVNALRKRFGAFTDCPRYGTDLFAAF